MLTVTFKILVILVHKWIMLIMIISGGELLAMVASNYLVLKT